MKAEINEKRVKYIKEYRTLTGHSSFKLAKRNISTGSNSVHVKGKRVCEYQIV